MLAHIEAILSMGKYGPHRRIDESLEKLFICDEVGPEGKEEILKQ